MKKILYALFVFVQFSVFAQNLTIDETVFGPRKYAPETLQMLQWRTDSHSISYMSNDFQNLMEKDQATNWKETALFSAKELNELLQKEFTNDTFDLKYFPYNFTWKSRNIIEAEVSGKNNNYYQFRCYFKKNNIESNLFFRRYRSLYFF